MLNFIRGDFYRLLHTKGFWITQAVILVFVSLSVFSMGTLGISAGDVEEKTAASILTGYSGIQMNLSPLLSYYALPLVMLVLGSEYSKGTLKNIVTVGISRTSYFFGKFISYAVVLFFQMLWIVLVSLLSGTFFGDGLGITERQQIQNLLYYFFGDFLLLLALSSFTIVALYIAKNTAVSILTAIIVPMLLLVGHMMQPKWKIWEYVDLQTGMDSLSASTFATIDTMYPVLIGAISILCLCLLLSHFIFNKQEF